MTARYTEHANAIEARDHQLSIKGTAQYDQNAPGLYPDETAYDLDTGDTVAVSVETTWQENGSGVHFEGFARHINADGSSVESSEGKQVLGQISVTVPPSQVTQFGVDAIATDVARLVIGEPVQLLIDEANNVPLIELPAAALSSVSVREQIALANATNGTPNLAL